MLGNNYETWVGRFFQQKKTKGNTKADLNKILLGNIGPIKTALYTNGEISFNANTQNRIKNTKMYTNILS